MIVVDSGVLTNALAVDEPDGVTARARLRGEVLVAPHLVDLEVLSAFRSMSRRGELGDARVRVAVADLARIPIRRVEHAGLAARCWELRENLTIYDATYVALAELLGVPLVTADGRLARAPGVTCEVQLLD